MTGSRVNGKEDMNKLIKFLNKIFKQERMHDAYTAMRIYQSKPVNISEFIMMQTLIDKDYTKSSFEKITLKHRAINHYLKRRHE